ncbi:PREDICTED: odorant receptor 49b-like [Dinoponera quadriceps]|uniref:Odorant receptor 49b-like n=1 Tax=Dinoponera quadriceps TaxID=609295 RepID=A0A6P3Y0G3_DINQU|nr:PREDICTED: odorant receptor 49b-like [Dinoponera quadriceps]
MQVFWDTLVMCSLGFLVMTSKLLADAAYSSLWYNMSLSQSKNILFVIMRSQRKLTLTAGRMANLSLETFTTIMKASVSYVSVFNAMY